MNFPKVVLKGTQLWLYCFKMALRGSFLLGISFALTFRNNVVLVYERRQPALFVTAAHKEQSRC